MEIAVLPAPDGSGEILEIRFQEQGADGSRVIRRHWFGTDGKRIIWRDMGTMTYGYFTCTAGTEPGLARSLKCPAGRDY